MQKAFLIQKVFKMEDNTIKLSQRLTEVAAYLPKGAYFADIGSDHAYLPCYVCQRDETAKAIAGEVNEGPYNSAKDNIRKNNLQDKIEVRLGDGLEILNSSDEVEQIVIAGMGGALITSILDRGKDKLAKVKRIIAQPNIDARKVRIWLHEHGFNLSNEQIVEENGHVYELLVADRSGETPYTESLIEKQFYFGPFLLLNKTAAFYQKWQGEKVKLQAIIKQMEKAGQPEKEKIERFQRELIWLKEELNGDENSC